MDNGNAARAHDFFGHPRGLSTLFFTELWERFSYYGMRALLVLFMTAEAVGDNPGLGIEVGEAAAIYGLYTFFVYVLSLPGGWVADNIWGQRKAVFVGGCIIAAGHFSMAIPTNTIEKIIRANTCGIRNSRPMPFTTMPRTITRKYRKGMNWLTN